jgi:hypothetical protein
MLCMPSAMIADDLIRFALSADAHRCCAAAHGQCAQLSTPDECCKTQEQATSQGFTSLPNAAPIRVEAPDALSLAMTPDVIAGVSERFSNHDVAAFKRPHDPPHLHPFPLLI